MINPRHTAQRRAAWNPRGRKGKEKEVSQAQKERHVAIFRKAFTQAHTEMQG